MISVPPFSFCLLSNICPPLSFLTCYILFLSPYVVNYPVRQLTEKAFPIRINSSNWIIVNV